MNYKKDFLYDLVQNFIKQYNFILNNIELKFKFKISKIAFKSFAWNGLK